MSDNYTDLSPYQRLGSAWNEIRNATEDVPEAIATRLEAILAAIDTVLLDLHPAGRIEPIPLCASGCRHCGGRAHGV